MAKRSGENPRIPLSDDLTFYFASSGSDTTGTGSSLAPFATMQNAWVVAARDYDFQNYEFNLFWLTGSASATYTGINTGLFGGSNLLNVSQVVLKGDNTTPGNVSLLQSSISNGACIFVGSAVHWISGFRFENASAGGAIYVGGNGYVILGEPTYSEASKCEYACVCAGAYTWYIGGIGMEDGSLGVSTIYLSAMSTSSPPQRLWHVVNDGYNYLYMPDFSISGAASFSLGIVGVSVPGGTVASDSLFANSTAATITGRPYYIVNGSKYATGYSCFPYYTGTAGYVDTYSIVNFYSAGNALTIQDYAVTHALLPSGPANGMIYTVTDSQTNVLGSVISSGGGSHKVLSFYQTESSQWVVVGAASPMPPIHVRASKTSDYSIDLTADNGKIFDNSGASTSVNLTIPAITSSNVGAYFGVTCVSAQTITVTAPASTTLSHGTVTSSVAGSVASTSPYSNIVLEAITSTSWVTNYAVGSWTVT